MECAAFHRYRAPSVSVLSPQCFGKVVIEDKVGVLAAVKNQYLSRFVGVSYESEVAAEEFQVKLPFTINDPLNCLCDNALFARSRLTLSEAAFIGRREIPSDRVLQHATFDDDLRARGWRRRGSGDRARPRAHTGGAIRLEGMDNRWRASAINVL